MKAVKAAWAQMTAKQLKKQIGCQLQIQITPGTICLFTQKSILIDDKWLPVITLTPTLIVHPKLQWILHHGNCSSRRVWCEVPGPKQLLICLAGTKVLSSSKMSLKKRFSTTIHCLTLFSHFDLAHRHLSYAFMSKCIVNDTQQPTWSLTAKIDF